MAGFTICGADNNYVAADAVISGNQVIVSSASVPNPVGVRYGWANFPLCNLYSMEGLPVSPFRTDDFDPRSAGQIAGPATASHNSDGAFKAFDGEFGNDSRWTTQTVQVPDMWFTLNLSAPAMVSEIVYDSSTYAGDSPAGYVLEVSTDNSSWTEVAAAGSSGPVSGVLTISFTPVEAQYIRLTQTGSNGGAYWGIEEITVVSSSSRSSYEDWASTNGITGGPNDDQDDDGLDNLSEYAVSEKPTSTQSGHIFQHVHQQRTDDPSLSFLVQTTTNLMTGPWTTDGIRVDTHVTGGTYNVVTSSVSILDPQSYIRLQIMDE